MLEEYIDLDEGKKLKTSVVERYIATATAITVIPAAQAMQSLGLNWD